MDASNLPKLEIKNAYLHNQKAYKPTASFVKKANVKQWNAFREKANKDPLAYWEKAAKDLFWYMPWQKVFDDSEKPFYKWFVDGKTNIVANCLDRHIGTEVENKTAIIWESDSGLKRKLTYKQLFYEVNKLANGLKQLRIGKGDRVAIYLQNIPEAAIAMLACAKIGAIHSVTYAGFAASALRKRIDDEGAKILITSDVGYRRDKELDMKHIVDEALQGNRTVQNVIVVQHGKKPVNMKKNRDVFYEALVQPQPKYCDTEMMDAEDPLFILFNSGTVERPKATVHVHGGYAVGVNQSFKLAFDIKDTDVFWSTADPGWITGHSYTIYAPLMAGITTIMYEGVPDFPRPDKIWRLINKYGVTILYTAPTFIRALMAQGDKWVKPELLKSLRLLGSVGEPINPEAWKWYYTKVGRKKCPIIDTWWQTETGSFMIAPQPTMPLKPGSATMAMPGIEAAVVDKKGRKMPVNKSGFLVIKKPWPSMMRTIWGEPQRFKELYFEPIPGYYFTGDLAVRDKDGYLWMQGRTDDVLKIAGHRIGTAEIEAAVTAHKSVAEAAVIGKPHKIKGESAKAFVVLKDGFSPDEKLEKDIKKTIRKQLGPIAVTDEIEFVKGLPKTRSGKVMRRLLKDHEAGKPLKNTTGLTERH